MGVDHLDREYDEVDSKERADLRELVRASVRDWVGSEAHWVYTFSRRGVDRGRPLSLHNDLLRQARHLATKELRRTCCMGGQQWWRFG